MHIIYIFARYSVQFKDSSVQLIFLNTLVRKPNNSTTTQNIITIVPDLNELIYIFVI